MLYVNFNSDIKRLLDKIDIFIVIQQLTLRGIKLAEGTNLGIYRITRVKRMVQTTHVAGNYSATG